MLTPQITSVNIQALVALQFPCCSDSKVFVHTTRQVEHVAKTFWLRGLSLCASLQKSAVQIQLEKRSRTPIPAFPRHHGPTVTHNTSPFRSTQPRHWDRTRSLDTPDRTHALTFLADKNLLSTVDSSSQYLKYRSRRLFLPRTDCQRSQTPETAYHVEYTDGAVFTSLLSKPR